MTEILRFEMNIPAEVALKDAGPGIPIEGRYGNRVMYTLADNRVMYVAPIVANRISDLKIQPGELFQVRKKLKKQGQRRLIEWDVQRLRSESETQLERELRESIEATQAAKAAQAPEASEAPNTQSSPPEETAPQAAALTTAIAPVSNRTCAARNANHPPAVTTELQSAPKTATSATEDAGTDLGTQQRAGPLIPTLSPTAVPTANGSASSAQRNGNGSPPVTTKLEHALKTAISAAYNAEKYGAELGYVVRFDADAIKSMAITVLINMSEGNRR